MEGDSRNQRNNSMNVQINGDDRELPDSTNLYGYLTSLGVDLSFIAVAVNGEVVPRDQLIDVTLFNGDRVEIVRAVGGG